MLSLIFDPVRSKANGGTSEIEKDQREILWLIRKKRRVDQERSLVLARSQWRRTATLSLSRAIPFSIQKTARFFLVRNFKITESETAIIPRWRDF